MPILESWLTITLNCLKNLTVSKDRDLLPYSVLVR